MVWPNLGSRTATEQNLLTYLLRTESYLMSYIAPANLLKKRNVNGAVKNTPNYSNEMDDRDEYIPSWSSPCTGPDLSLWTPLEAPIHPQML